MIKPMMVFLKSIASWIILRNCNEYGGLYQWDEMMQHSSGLAAQGICPEGWHLPTDNEWKYLEGYVDSRV